jgi:PhnB protein
MTPIPAERRGVVPYLIVKEARAALDFYARAFGAQELLRLDEPDGRIGHAELRLGGADLMLADEFPERGILGPVTLGGSPVMLHLYVEDVDALVARASAAGAEVKRPPTDQFYGDRSAELRCPFGHRWLFATRLEEVSPEEMKRRAAAQRE